MNNLGFGVKRLTAASIIALLSSFGITTIALASSEATTAQGEVISKQECPEQTAYIDKRLQNSSEEYQKKIDEYNKYLKEYQDKKWLLEQQLSQEVKDKEKIDEYQKKIDEYQKKIDKYENTKDSLKQEWREGLEFVWQKICENEEADFANLSERKIPAELLRIILLDESLKKYLPTKVTIKDATITGELDLSAEEIEQQLHLESSTFQGKVKLTESKFLQSLYFDGSTFQKPLDMESAIFERSLYIRGATFEKAENNTLNLSKARIDGTLSLTSSGNPMLPESEADEDKQNKEDKDNKPTKFEFNCQERKKPEDGLMRIINLQLIEIKQSLDIRKLQLKNKNPCDYSKKVNEGKEPLFFANTSKIGHAIIIDGDTGFDKLDFENSKANMLVFAISREAKDKLGNIEIDNILHSFNNKILNIVDNWNVPKLEKELTELDNTSYLLQQKVNLKEVELNKITVYPRKDYPRKGEDPTDNKDKTNDENTTDSEGETENSCNIELDGLVSTTIDTLAAKFFLICLRQHYRDATNEVKKQDINKKIEELKEAKEKVNKVEEELNKVKTSGNKLIIEQGAKLSSLIQPLENAATMAKMLGKEKVSTRMSYQRKSLDVHIATIDIFNRRHYCMDFYGSRCPFFAVVERFNHGWLTLLNVFYGFGYYRMQALWSVFGLFVVGVIFAWIEMSKKQKNIISDAILDSVNYTVKNCSESAVAKKFEELEPDLEFFANIEAVIFDYSNYQESEKFDFLIEKKGEQTINSSNKYLKITLDNQENNKKNLKWFIDRLETYNPDAKKMGFCHNFYGQNRLYLVIPHETTRKNLKIKINQFDLKKIKDIQEYLDSETIGKFRLFSIKQEREIRLPHRITKGWRSMIYSLDNIFPIIELDKELQEFIFEDSERLTRVALQCQQIAAKIILIILLPILFL
ncbi:hypothetical protein [Crocosphaera sp.]|uniref:hypothetical protein n=1 Tax=Crocosphaera sp. TaxID=2729996 RepID=UPI003F203E4D|nr:hypothetical protein [Crocosphaera sp.]